MLTPDRKGRRKTLSLIIDCTSIKLMYCLRNELMVHSSCMSPTVSGMSELCTILPWVWGPQFFNSPLAMGVVLYTNDYIQMMVTG